MAAQIQNIHICSGCGEGITSNGPLTSCPKCGNIIGNIDKITLPITVVEQIKKLAVSKEDVPGIYLDIPEEKSFKMLLDAYYIVKVIAGKKSSIEEISKLMDLAKSIGEIACKYEDFLKAGGLHVYKVDPENELMQEKQNEPAANTTEFKG